jgi:hypothetical protein
MAPSTTGHNLIQVLTAMRNYGIGVNVRRSVWSNPGCYWTVTRCASSALSFAVAAAAAIAVATTTLLLPPLLPHRCGHHCCFPRPPPLHVSSLSLPPLSVCSIPSLTLKLPVPSCLTFPPCAYEYRLKLNPRSPLKHGKVWGVYHWNHRQIGQETRIGGVHKKQWLLDAEQSSDLNPDQLRSMLKGLPQPPSSAAAAAVEQQQ